MRTRTRDTSGWSIHRSLLELFDEPTFRARVHAVLDGLGRPKDSGEYRYATLQIQRLAAPAAAVVLPLLILLLLAAASRVQRKAAPVDRSIWIGRETPPLAVLLPPSPDGPPDMSPTSPDLPGLPPDAQAVPPEGAPSVPPPEPMAVFPVPGVVPSVRMPVRTGTPLSTREPGTRLRILEKQGERGSRSELAVLRALRWLKKYQEPNGQWLTQSGGGPGGHGGAAPAMTGLALLTFLAHAERADSPEFGSAVRRGLEWLIANQRPDGRFAGSDPNEYSLPIAAYALCEAGAMTGVPCVREAAERAVSPLIRGQNPGGLWSYRCVPEERNDTSYSGWCAQALKAAMIARLDVPGLREAAGRAVAGFKASYDSEAGIFRYTSQDAHGGSLTGTGVLCMQLLGAGKDYRVAGALSWLDRATCRWDEPWTANPIYAWYYVTQARFHAGGAAWEKWDRQFAAQLVGHQVVLAAAIEGLDGKPVEIGFWKPAGAGEFSQSYVYNTTLCALMLTVYYRNLQTYQPPAETGDADIGFGDKENDIRIRVM
jgi:hypothetical protein